MDFRLRKDAKDWFREVSAAFPLDYDLYYLCLVAGLAARRKTNVEAEATVSLVENYPGEYRTRGRLLVGLLLHNELKSLGVSLANREEAHKVIAGLISPDSPSYLSDDGVRAMDQYAHGGFGVLCGYFGDDRPRTVETFLRKYTQCVRDASRGLE